MPSVPPVVGGLLGADFVIDQGRYKVTRIYDNEVGILIYARHSQHLARQLTSVNTYWRSTASN
jgi:hypothetical protein